MWVPFCALSYQQINRYYFVSNSCNKTYTIPNFTCHLVMEAGGHSCCVCQQYLSLCLMKTDNNIIKYLIISCLYHSSSIRYMTVRRLWYRSITNRENRLLTKLNLSILDLWHLPYVYYSCEKKILYSK